MNTKLINQLHSLADAITYNDYLHNCNDELILQNFAELIVKECIKSVESNIDEIPIDDFNRGYNFGINSSISSIRNLFEIY